MNKIIKIVVCICFTFIVCGADLSYKVKAEDDFEINERDYIERCKSSEMSKKDIEICSQFNEYLKAKNENLKNSMSDLQSSIDDTEGQIDTLRDEIDAIDLQIQNKQEEINYASENINTLTNNIQELEESLKARLYAMQMYINSNQFFGFIIGATSFSDLFSRIDGVNQLTSYDKDLMNRLANDKIANEEQKNLMEESKNNLALLQEQKGLYEDQLNAQLADLTAKLGYIEQEQKLTEPVINQLASAVANSQASIAEEEAYQKWLQEQQNKPSTPDNGGTDNPGDNSGSDNGNGDTDSGNNGSGDNGNNNQDTFALGLQIVQKAMSQKGSPYVWGGKGQPITSELIGWLKSAYKDATAAGWYNGLENYYDSGTLAFDCSGLTYWAYKQFGIYVGYSTYDQQDNGYEVSWDNMQPGDLILFDWDYDGRTDHVGMYAGNGMMVHTSTPNDGLGVHKIVLNADITWYNHCYTIRRFI